MIKKLTLLCVFVLAVSSCKVKQKATYSAASKRSPEIVVDKKNEPYKNSEEDGLFPLPEDSGKFQKFEIASIEEYINTFSEIAQYEMKAFGIPASITLAQGLLESGFGKGKLASKTNNHFGIKCHTGWQGDYDFHDDDEKGECFRKYNHPMYSYRDHSHFLTSRSRYAFLFELKPNDYKKWAKGLSTAGYATDRKYPQKLIALIERYKLNQFDLPIETENTLANPAASMQKTTATYTIKKGDTLYSISKRFAISIDDLKRINKMKNSNLAIGQRILIETK